MNLVEVLVEEHGDLKERAGREPGHANTAVALQTEECAKTLLASSRRTELNEEMSGLAADVSQAVGRPGRDDDHVSLTGHAPDPAQPEAELAGYALESFPLLGVHVCRHEPAGPHEQLAADAAGRPLAEDDRLPAHGIRDSVYAWLDHSI